MPLPSDSYLPGRLMRSLQERYSFLGLLGQGGCGVVFEVENRTLGRREALKLFNEGFSRDGSQRFEQEARIMAALDHRHIVPIYSFGEDGGCLWYAMKLVEGPTLSVLLKAKGKRDVADALRIGIPMLEALAFTHERGVIHRDIKPANILLDPKKGPFLSDFGIAKAESDSHRTETGAFLGTPAFISPEQGLGRPVDGRTDLYSLGMVLYQVLTGRLPFDEGNSLAVMMQRFQTEAQSPRIHRPEIPEGIAAVIDKALAMDPGQRYDTAGQMREALIQAAEGHGLAWRRPLDIPTGMGPVIQEIPEEWAEVLDPAGPTSPLPRIRRAKAEDTGAAGRSPRTARSMLPLGAAALALAGLAIWFLWARRESPGPSPAGPAAQFRKTGPAPASPSPLSPSKAAGRVPKEPPRPAEVVRRAVTPAHLLEPPVVDASMSAGCAGSAATVEVQVNESGEVSAARILSQIPAPCKESILKAARSCRFKPALAADGLPVSSTTAIAIEL